MSASAVTWIGKGGQHVWYSPETAERRAALIRLPKLSGGAKGF
jgi:hypothetical protein